jgi:aspartokinase
MFTAEPARRPRRRLLTRLDYAEAQEIATTGAKVLHPRSIAPCRDAGVPMAILDTERFDLPGTRIDAERRDRAGVKAISRRNGIVLVSMESIGMWQAGRLPGRCVRALQAPRPVDRPDRFVGNQRHRVARSQREPGHHQRARSLSADLPKSAG